MTLGASVVVASVRVPHRLQLGVHPQLLQNSLNVASGGVEPYTQSGRDAFIVQAMTDQLQDLAFPHRQLADPRAVSVTDVQRLALHGPVEHVCRHRDLASRGLPDCGSEGLE